MFFFQRKEKKKKKIFGGKNLKSFFKIVGKTKAPFIFWEKISHKTKCFGINTPFCPPFLKTFWAPPPRGGVLKLPKF